MFGFNKKELEIFKKLNSPKKIQDFLDIIPINFEKHGETCMSPRMLLKTRKCHCIEGAMFAAAALRFHGYKPLVVDMKGTKDDWDHVIAVFKKDKKWGCITKTNHVVLRYREPVYNSIRELVMSYFHEYTDDKDKGKKTLRSFSMSVDLSKFDNKNWMTDEKDLWYINDYLDEVKHYQILTRKQIKNLRKTDKIEIDMGKLVEWSPNRKRKNKHIIKNI